MSCVLSPDFESTELWKMMSKMKCLQNSNLPSTIIQYTRHKKVAIILKKISFLIELTFLVETDNKQNKWVKYNLQYVRKYMPERKNKSGKNRIMCVWV